MHTRRDHRSLHRAFVKDLSCRANRHNASARCASAGSPTHPHSSASRTRYRGGGGGWGVGCGPRTALPSLSIGTAKPAIHDGVLGTAGGPVLDRNHRECDLKRWWLNLFLANARSNAWWHRSCLTEGKAAKTGSQVISAMPLIAAEIAHDSERRLLHSPCQPALRARKVDVNMH